MPGWPNCPKYARSLRTCASVRLRLSPSCLLEMVRRSFRWNDSNCRRYKLNLRTAGSGMDSGRDGSILLLDFNESAAGGIIPRQAGASRQGRGMTNDQDAE